VQQQQQQQAMVTVDPQMLNDIANQGAIHGGSVVGAVLSVAGGLLWLRRRMSRDRLEVKKDSAETQLLEIIIKERNAAMDDAREAWSNRAADSKLIGALQAEVHGLRELNQKTNNEVELLRLLNARQSDDIETLRREINAVKEQIHSCMSCPLRRKE